MHPKTNPFESGHRKVIPAVLVYVQHRDQILMIHRNSKNPGRIDYHEGKWNGLGGKLELDESPLEAAQREVLEESGIELTAGQLSSLGSILFPNFKAHKNEDWMVFLFHAHLNSETGLPEWKRTVEEGDLHWVPARDLATLNLWPGDRYFISHMIDQQPITGTIWYQNGDVVRHWIQPLKKNL
jgi:8-oxo-dGTP diphosphatase